MKNANSSPLFLLLFFAFSIFSACQMEGGTKECDLNRLSTIERHYDDGGAITKPDFYFEFEGKDCMTDSCSAFTLDLSNPPNYSFQYFLLFLEDGVVDTLQKQENGTYSLNYCKSTDNPPAQAGPTNSGTIFLRPQNTNPYTLNFGQQSRVFSISNFELKQGKSFTIYLNPI